MLILFQNYSSLLLIPNRKNRNNRFYELLVKLMRDWWRKDTCFEEFRRSGATIFYAYIERRETCYSSLRANRSDTRIDDIRKGWH